MNKTEKRGSIFEIIRNLLFPPHCFFCGALVEWDTVCCPACKPLMEITPQQEKDIFGCDLICWSAPYAERLRAGMERFKFQGIRRGREIFGAMLLAALKENNALQDIDAITFVPMPRRRERRRGYNQAKLLAEYLAEETGLPLREGLLHRKDRGEMHRTVSRAARTALAEGSYCCGKNTPVPGERLLLVDDIITSGATLGVCAALLRQGGAKHIVGAAALRTPSASVKEQL